MKSELETSARRALPPAQHPEKESGTVDQVRSADAHRQPFRYEHTDTQVCRFPQQYVRHDLSELTTQIEVACLLEATARKPGNVHPAASFRDLDYADFVAAARLCAPHLATAGEIGIGSAVLRAVRATREAVRSNANLGICLLLAPIAAIPDPATLRQDLVFLLEETTIGDAEAVYTAIRQAQPGGLGEVAEHDVAAPPTITLAEAMRLAADRDGIAWAWETRFREIDRETAGILRETWQDAVAAPDSIPRLRDGTLLPPWEAAVITLHLHWMSRGDTLILRKCGPEIAEESRRRAESVLSAGGCLTVAGQQRLEELDAWLRADGHRRNPGTSADLVAACLLWGLRKGWLTPPSKSEIEQHARAIAAAHLP